MAAITLKGLKKSYGATHVIKGVDIDIEDGEFVGPSGCGKSTLLRMIAGLEDISDGTLSTLGKVMNDLPPKDRGVAIGRAILRKPQVFLFDEPLSNLDAALRMDMRMQIGKLHQQLGATMVHVTHDLVEAMTLADKIVVLKDGLVQQIGSPMDLYHNPENLFVAGFLGSPAMNFLDVDVIEVTGSTATVRNT